MRTASIRSEFRSPASRVRLLRLLNGPPNEPAGSRAYDRRALHRQLILRYEIGREHRTVVALALGLSLRQFHREHRAALDWVLPEFGGATGPEPCKPAGVSNIERVALERVAPALPFVDANRRFEIFLACQVEPLSRAQAHLALYEFLNARDERDAVRAARPALSESIAAIVNEQERSRAQARRNLVDAQIGWRDGSYVQALAQASAATRVFMRLVEAGACDDAVRLCSALQLEAQLRWETGGAAEALAALDAADILIRRHSLERFPCAVTNSVGRSDLLMRNASRVSEAIGIASAAFDRAALYGDSEDAASALLISAMAQCGQRRFSAAREYIGYALQFVDDLPPVGRTRVLSHAAEVLVVSGCSAQAAKVLTRAKGLVSLGSIAHAQRELRVALLAAHSGSPNDALPIVDRAIDQLESKGATRFIGPGLAIRARIRAALDDRSGAIADLECAVGYLRGESYAWTYAQALGEFGRATKNRTLVHEASALAQAMGRH